MQLACADPWPRHVGSLFSYHLSNLMTFSGFELLDSAFILKALSYRVSAKSNCDDVPEAKNSFVVILEAIVGITVDRLSS